MGKRVPEKPWGSLRMRFVIDEHNAKREAGITGHAGQQPSADDESLAIDPASHGIRNVVVVVPHVSRVHEMYVDESAKSAVLIQDDTRFVPRVLPVMVRQELKIQNRGVNRQVALIRHSLGQRVDLLTAPGDEAVWQFTHAGFSPAEVTCTSHPSMRAHLVVVDNPYVGVSDDQGVVSLTNVPAGEELDLRIWHERSGWLVLYKGDLRVVVPADGLMDLGEVFIPAADLANSIDLDREKHVGH